MPNSRKAPFANSGSQPKASWNVLNGSPTSGSAASFEPPRSHVLTADYARYPLFSLVKTHGLVGRLPPKVVEVVHNLAQTSTESQRNLALAELAKRLGAIVAVGRHQKQRLDEEEMSAAEEVEEVGGWLNDGWVKDMESVWLYHLPSLLLSQNLTHITLFNHDLLSQIRPTILDDHVPFLAPFHRRNNVLGSLFVSSSVASLGPTRVASSSPFPPVSSLKKVELDYILAYVRSSIYFPGELWQTIDESDGHEERSTAAKSRKKAKHLSVGDEKLTKKEKQNERDEMKRLEEQEKIETSIREGGWVALGRLVRELRPNEATAHLYRLFSDRFFWSSLSSSCVLGLKGDSLGYNDFMTRKSSWETLADVVRYQPDLVRTNLAIISRVVFQSCWEEKEAEVVKSMARGLGAFLNTFPESWTLEYSAFFASRDSEPWIEDDSPLPSKVFLSFLAWLRSACRGNPLEGYPIVLEIVRSMPPLIFPLTTSSLRILFDAVWSPHERLLALPPSESAPAVRALLLAVQNLNTFLFEKRLQEVDFAHPDARQFASEQMEGVLRAGGVDSLAGAGLIGDPLSGIRDDDGGFSDEEYGYDEEDDDEDEDEGEEGEGGGELKEDRQSEGSGAEERLTRWDGENRLSLRGEELESELEQDPHHSLTALLVTSTLPTALLCTITTLLATRSALTYLDLSHLKQSSSVFVVPLLNHLVASGTTLPLRHLSLANCCTHYNPTSLSISTLQTSLVALLSLGRSGLEYLDLRGTALFTNEDTLEELVEVIEDSNRAVQLIWFDPRTSRRSNTGWSYLRDRLNDALEKNRARRKLAQSSALGVLGGWRVMLHVKEGGGGLGLLPLELVQEILGYASTPGLSEKQVRRVMDWAGERGTLEGGKGRRQFLEETDCWRFEGE